MGGFYEMEKLGLITVTDIEQMTHRNCSTKHKRLHLLLLLPDSKNPSCRVSVHIIDKQKKNKPCTYCHQSYL